MIITSLPSLFFHLYMICDGRQIPPTFSSSHILEFLPWCHATCGRAPHSIISDHSNHSDQVLEDADMLLALLALCTSLPLSLISSLLTNFISPSDHGIALPAVELRILRYLPVRLCIPDCYRCRRNTYPPLPALCTSPPPCHIIYTNHLRST